MGVRLAVLVVNSASSQLVLGGLPPLMDFGFARCANAGDRMRQNDPMVRLGLVMIVMLALLVIVIIFRSFLHHHG